MKLKKKMRCYTRLKDIMNFFSQNYFFLNSNPVIQQNKLTNVEFPWHEEDLQAADPVLGSSLLITNEVFKGACFKDRLKADFKYRCKMYEDLQTKKW